MNLDPGRIEGIRVGSLLHDVGKVFIPADLLLKPTRLTAAEHQLMITHVRSGIELLQDIPFPWPIRRMVLEHHERIDGSGYPDGLRGESLMLESRILAVADVVDAIASPRSYRPARGIEVALYDIKGFRGIRYDPGVVDACLVLFEEKDYRLPMDYD
jgi:HD-GYP domain-containing protein (c-di-GMP phosphodiesterase class II)